jgi:hypothetical protein
MEMSFKQQLPPPPPPQQQQQQQQQQRLQAVMVIPDEAALVLCFAPTLKNPQAQSLLWLQRLLMTAMKHGLMSPKRILRLHFRRHHRQQLPPQPLVQQWPPRPLKLPPFHLKHPNLCRLQQHLRRLCRRSPTAQTLFGKGVLLTSL